MYNLIIDQLRFCVYVIQKVQPTDTLYNEGFEDHGFDDVSSIFFIVVDVVEIMFLHFSVCPIIVEPRDYQHLDFQNAFNKC